MSGVSREGLVDVLRAVRAQVTADRIKIVAVEDEPEDDTWRP
jgi:GTP-binding protein